MVSGKSAKQLISKTKTDRRHTKEKKVNERVGYGSSDNAYEFRRNNRRKKTTVTATTNRERERER